MHEYVRKTILGNVPARTLAVTIDNDDTSIVINDGTSWPTAANGPFVIAIGRGSAIEEKVLCSARSGSTLTVMDRGYDGTSAQAHVSGVAVEHVLDAATIDQANRLANLLTAVGQLIGFNGTNPVAIAAATDGQILAGDSGAATGLAFIDIPDVVSDPSAPNAATTVYKLWYDETLNTLRHSDGAAWPISKTVFVFANAGARTSALGGTPPNGLFSAIGSRLYVSLGGAWLRVGNENVVSASEPDPANYLVGDLWSRPV